MRRRVGSVFGHPVRHRRPERPLCQERRHGEELSLGRDGINSSQLGFRGIEDLGGGLQGRLPAARARCDPDDWARRRRRRKFWNRRSTVSLFGDSGEAPPRPRLHPDVLEQRRFRRVRHQRSRRFDHVLQMLSATFVRADNSIGYFLPPNMGGFYGQFMVAAAEGGPGRPDGQRSLLGGRDRLRCRSVRCRRSRSRAAERSALRTSSSRRPTTSAARGTSASSSCWATSIATTLPN